MNTHEKEMLLKHDRALFGLNPDQADGLVSITTGHDAVLHGTDRNPGGLITSVDRLTKALYVSTGFLMAGQIGWALFVYLTRK